MSKRVTKSQLEEMNSDLSTRINNLESLIMGHRRQMSNILEKQGLLSFDEIEHMASKAQGRLFSEGMMLPIVDHTVKAENDKLWYLVRVAMHDEKRNEPVNMNEMRKKFRDPDWN